MESKTRKANHGTVFTMLVVLVFGSVGISLLHLPATANNLGIFGIALVMTALVSLQYMNLKIEGDEAKRFIEIVQTYAGPPGSGRRPKRG